MTKVTRSALMIGILMSSLLVGIAQPEPEEMKCDVTARFACTVQDQACAPVVEKHFSGDFVIIPALSKLRESSGKDEGLEIRSWGGNKLNTITAHAVDFTIYFQLITGQGLSWTLYTADMEDYKIRRGQLVEIGHVLGSTVISYALCSLPEKAVEQ